MTFNLMILTQETVLPDFVVVHDCNSIGTSNYLVSHLTILANLPLRFIWLILYSYHSPPIQRV